MSAGADPLAGIGRAAAVQSLAIFGAFHPDAGGTLVLLGPKEPGFWPHLTAQPEWHDGAPDPVDRWSVRVIGALAEAFGAEPRFPFGGPPHHPFYDWAIASGQAWASPVALLVHEAAGLMVSYRGALLLPERLDLPARAKESPCARCVARPCLEACPAGALVAGRYDVASCRAYLDRPEGLDCRTRGCSVRRACPVSANYGRLELQSAYHMGQFHQ